MVEEGKEGKSGARGAGGWAGGGNPEGLFQASLLTGKRRSWTRLLNQGSVIYASNSLQL